MERKCINCKTIFETDKRTRFCCNDCKMEYRLKHGGVRKICEFCGSEYIAPKEGKDQRFCSTECQSKWQKEYLVGDKANRFIKREKAHCIWCGKEFYMKNYRIGITENNFCCEDCRRKWYSNVFSQSEEWKEESRKRAVKILEDDKINKVNSKPQVIVNELIKNLGLQYQNELNCEFYSIDTCINNNNKRYFIEVMGTFWHCDRRFYNKIQYKNQYDRIIKDKAKYSYIKNNYNSEILYLWEYDILNNIEMIACLIDNFINDNLKIYDSSLYLFYDNKLKINDNIDLQFMNLESEHISDFVDISIKEKVSQKQINKWIVFNCDFCGKESEQLLSRYNKHKKHYCSTECRIKDMQNKK